MTLGSSGERSDLSSDARRASRPPRSTRGPASDRADLQADDSLRDDAFRDDALRIAVETLSAEICWYFATDAGARGVLASATDPMWRRPRP
jgi:hypothetical protein